MRKFALISALMLSACLEPQPAPEITDLSSSDLTVETISDQLKKPWGVATLPDGSYLVTEFEGGLKHIKDGQTREIGGVLDISGFPRGSLHVKGQGGLMGIVLAPDFAESREVFLSLSFVEKTRLQNSTAVYRGTLDGDKLTDGRIIFTSAKKDTWSHFGGRMVFLPDGTLVLTLGDGFTYRESAQNLKSQLGKIVRMDRDGKPVADNPFAGNADANPYVYSYGHRNVQGIAFDSSTGNLWAHEHGPRGGDELNLIKEGANYGWPLATTGTDYNGAKITPHRSYAGTEPFVYDWTPSIAPSGLTIYQGDMFPEWKGDAFVGALVGRSVWRIDLDGTKAKGETRLLADLGARIRDVKTDQDGALLVLTESKDGGQLLRITPK